MVKKQIDHPIAGLARTLSEGSRTTLHTQLQAIYRITDAAKSFPAGTQVTFGRIAFFIEEAQKRYDFAGLRLARNLNQSFAEIKQHLLTLEADGEDISLCREILAQAGIPLNAPDPLPKPPQLKHLK